MHVALITDALDQPWRGNHTTVRRWLALCPGEVRGYEADPELTLDPVPDLFHGYHAWRGGVAARALARRYDRPFAVALGGTDLYELRTGGPRAALVASLLAEADLVTGAFPGFAGDYEYAVVPRSVERPEGAAAPPPRPLDGALRALLPAGWRPEKDLELALRLAARLHDAGVALRLRIVGRVLDEAYAARVREAAAGRVDVEFGELPPARMPAAYAAADVVWNTSVFEGGANALLEGAAAGCALFARDVPGNRDLLREPGAPGTLFDPDDEDAVLEYHRALRTEDPHDRRERTARWLEAQHAPALEAAALRAAWRRALA